MIPTPTSFDRRPAEPTFAAADRAETVGAPEAAEAAYLVAAELSPDEAEKARLHRTGGEHGTRRRP